jgi:transcriptional regulator with XRE-family HTH domain
MTMPDIIDNVKVGEVIKKLLRKNNMTQSDLADALSISKSAVSQNLSGRSTFDIQNLIEISKIFSITLDDLLNLKTDITPEVISEYEKIVNLGLEEIKKVHAGDLRISQPDFYGRVLVDYIIDQRKLNMLLYLDEQGVEMVQGYYHRAKEVYLRIIRYLLEENREEILKYILKYTEIQGSFVIEDEAVCYIIWGLLNQPNHQRIVRSLMTYQPSDKAKRFSLFRSEKKAVPLTRMDYIDLVGKYHLEHVWKTFLDTYHRDDDFSRVVDHFIPYQFFQGISMFISHHFTKPLGWMKKMSLEVQKSFLAILKTHETDLVMEFAQAGLYTDMTQIVKQAILEHQEKVFSHLIAHYHDVILFRKVAETCVEISHTDLLDKIMCYLKPDDLNYLLAWTHTDDLEMMLYLLNHGAKIDDKYYNLETFRKINHLIEYFLRKEE